MLANNAVYSHEAVIAVDHPCLAGHFPGNPVVPGVLILDVVAQALQQWQPDSRIAGMPQIKFQQLLRPSEPFTITLSEQSPHRIGFTCRRQRDSIASGLLHIEVRP